jgi:hypothetical protein
MAIEQRKEQGARLDTVNLYIEAAGLGLVGIGIIYALMVSRKIRCIRIYIYLEGRQWRHGSRTWC